MTRRDPAYLLEDIRSAAKDAIAFTAGLDRSAFQAVPVSDRKTYRAIKNALSEIGEAVKLLPPEMLARHPEIDWRGWAGLRDVVSHEYFRLEMSRLRLTIEVELPPLLAVVRSEATQSQS